MPAWLSISCPGNNGTGRFSYLLETARLTFGDHITSCEFYRGTGNELPNGKEDFNDQSPFHCIMLLTVLYLKHCFYKINNVKGKSSGSGSRIPRLTAVEIRCADHATPSIRKSWH
jgi:hypothetical protein